MRDFQVVKLSELITQSKNTERISDMENEHYITLSLYGNGAHERVIKDGKYPVPFLGYRVSAGQFIYSRIDARNGAYGIIGPELDGFVVSKDFPIYDINTDRIHPRFLLRSVLSDGFINQVKQSSFGATNRMRIKEEIFENYSIRLPSLERQKEIANLLDNAKRVILLRQQELQKLDELIKARFVEMFGDVNDNPKGWPEVRFDDCFEITSSKRILKSEWISEGIPFLRVRDMVQLATTGKMDNEFYVSEKFYSTLSDSDGIPKAGDILMSATSTLGKCHIVSDGERFYFKDADVLRFRAKMEINPIFFVEQMKTHYIEEQISKTLGVTTVAHFTIKAAKSISLRLPDIGLQNQFATFVKQVDKSKVAVQAALDKAQLLFDSLMQEYFG